MSMTTKPVMIAQMAESLIQSSTYFDVSAGGEVIFSGSDFVTELIGSYHSWYFLFCKFGAFTEPIQWFKELWTSYKSKNLDNWIKAYDAYTLEYNPLQNYSREIQTGYKNTKTLQHGKISTSTTTDMTSETEYDSDTTDDTTTFETPVSYRDAMKSTHGGKDTVTVNGTVEVADTGTDTITDTRLKADNTVTENGRSGQSMPDEIAKEIQLRLADDLSDEIINGFINKHLFLLPSEECDSICR